jgi:hypothetical protein
MSRESYAKRGEKNLDLVAKGRFLSGGILLLASLSLGVFTLHGFLVSGMGIIAMAASLILMKKPGYILLLIGG